MEQQVQAGVTNECPGLGEIKAVLLVRRVSKYMRKKYGVENAQKLNIDKAIKKGLWIKK